MKKEEGAPTVASGSDGLSPKARRTRELLIGAARTVFTRDGFLDARISDIAAEAQVAHGTFYTYFESKEAAFREVMIRLFDELREDPTPYHSDDPTESVEHANRRFLEVYRRNAQLMATVEQVVTFSEDIRNLRRELRTPWLERNIRAIRRWQQSGLADPELDPEYAAAALQAMVDRFMYVWVVLQHDFDEERAVKTVTRMWVQALGMPAPKSLRSFTKKGGSRKAAADRKTTSAGASTSA